MSWFAVLLRGWSVSPRRLGIAVAAGLLSSGAVVATSAIAAQTPPDASSSYSFKTLDNPADLTFNQLLGINNSGEISGYFGSGMQGHPNKGYTLAHNGAGGHYRNENYPHSVQTQVTGLNNSGVTVGFWSSAMGTSGPDFGFYERNNHFYTADYPAGHPASPPVDQLLGVNDAGVAVGFYMSKSGNSNGYSYNIHTHRYSRINVPGATSVTAAAINDAGDVAGFATVSGNENGFLKLRNGRVYTLSVPGASMTQAFGVNDSDEVVGAYTVGSGASAMTYGFVWSRAHGFKTVNDPGGVGATTINGVNDHGRLVGFYTDSAGNTDGFLATP